MSVMVLPGRNPIVLAKELATLDRLSNGRLLPAFGLGVADPHEQQAFGVERSARAKLFDEALAVLRGAWAEGSLTHHGDHFHYDDLRVLPKPRQAHLDVWLGGIAPSELRRVGTSGRRMAAQLRHARRCRTRPRGDRGGRSPNTAEPSTPTTTARSSPTRPARSRSAVVDLLAKRRPDLADPTVLVPQGWDALMETIDRFVAVGTTKFVILPIVEPATPHDWIDHLEQAAPIVLARQT